MHELSGKVAVVTGAGSGVGRAIAVGLARHGARVGLAGRREGALAETARSVQDSGGTALVVPADVARIEAVDELRARVGAVLGSLDILVNAAGLFGPIQHLIDSDPRRWIETIEINLIGQPLVVSQLLLPRFFVSQGITCERFRRSWERAELVLFDRREQYITSSGGLRTRRFRGSCGFRICHCWECLVGFVVNTIRCLCLLALWTATVSIAAAEPPPELARWLGPQNWRKDTDAPIVSLGKPNEFDDMHIFAPTVALEDGRYSMW